MMNGIKYITMLHDGRDSVIVEDKSNEEYDDDAEFDKVMSDNGKP